MKNFLKEVFGSQVHQLLAVAIIAAASVPALTNTISLAGYTEQDYGSVSHHVVNTGYVLGDSTSTPQAIPMRGQACSASSNSSQSQACLMYEIGKFDSQKKMWGVLVTYKLKNLKSGSLYLDDQPLVKRLPHGGNFKAQNILAVGASQNLILYSQANGQGMALVTLPISGPSDPSNAGSINGVPFMMMSGNDGNASSTPNMNCNFPPAPQGFHYAGRAEKLCAILLVKDGVTLGGLGESDDHSSSTMAHMPDASNMSRPPMQFDNSTSTPPRPPLNDNHLMNNEGQ